MLDSLFGSLQPRRLPAAPDPSAAADDSGLATRASATADVVVERSPVETMRRHFAAERQAGRPLPPMLSLLDPSRLWAGAVLRALSEAGGQPLQRLALREQGTLRTLAVIERTLVPRRGAEPLRVYHADPRPGGLDGGLDADALGLALAEASRLTAVLVGALQPQALLALLGRLLQASHEPGWRGRDLVFLLPPSAAALGDRIARQPWPAGLRVQTVAEPLGTTAGIWNGVLGAWEAAQRPAAAPAGPGPAAEAGGSAPPQPAPAAAPGWAPALPAREALNRLLQPLSRSEGLRACGVVDLRSGDLLASQSRGHPPAELAALALALCQARQVQLAVARPAAPADEVLVSAGAQQWLLRSLPGDAALGFVALLDRHQANLSLLRFRLLDAERLLG